MDLLGQLSISFSRGKLLHGVWRLLYGFARVRYWPLSWIGSISSYPTPVSRITQTRRHKVTRKPTQTIEPGKWTTQMTYECESKSFRTKSVTKYMFTFGIIHWEATQRFMTAKLIGLAHKMAPQLHLVAENCTIYSSRSSRPVRKLLDTPTYIWRFEAQQMSIIKVTHWLEVMYVVESFKNLCFLLCRLFVSTDRGSRIWGLFWTKHTKGSGRKRKRC
jgi:hypothetical protein